MPKLKLDLDELAVESFDAQAERESGRGTVKANGCCYCCCNPCCCSYYCYSYHVPECYTIYVPDSCEYCTWDGATCQCTVDCSDGCYGTRPIDCGPDIQQPVY